MSLRKDMPRFLGWAQARVPVQGGGQGRRSREEGMLGSPVQGLVLEAEMNSLNGQKWACKGSGLRRRRGDPQCAKRSRERMSPAAGEGKRLKNARGVVFP